MSEAKIFKNQIIDDYYQDRFSEENPLRILLLEDVSSDAELVSYYVGEIEVPHKILHVKNKLDFLSELDIFTPHFVISDFRLPQYSGKEALIHVRGRCEYLPFIICTGRVNEETAVECIKLGADDYVLKDDLSRLGSAMSNTIISRKTQIQKDYLSEQLIKREENLRAITLNSPSNIYTIDRDGVFLFTSNSKNTSTVKIGDSIFDFTDEINYQTIRNKIKECFDEQKNVNFELIGTDTAPNLDWFSCKMGPIIIDGKVEQAVFIPHDITDVKKAQFELDDLNNRLNRLNNHLENVRDEEKKKIAMEIHDQLGQELTGNKLGLYWLKQNLQNADEAVQNKVDELIDLSTQIIGTVRRIAHELRPVVLDDIGLVAALEWHIANINKSNSNFECKLEIDTDNEAFEPDISTSLYRIVQESITNVQKHAAANNVSIYLKKRDNDQIALSIKDDGEGLNVKEALQSKSMGIFGMQERIKKYNGDFKLISDGKGAKTGTEILININLSK